MNDAGLADAMNDTAHAMSVYKTEKAVYTPEDFILWQEKEILEISPKFQRRSVWGTPARSYFIDTMLRGMTVSPLYLRLAQNEAKTKTVREVVDGQQRVRTVLEFVADGGYRLSRTLKAPWGGKTFRELSRDQQHQIMHFGFSTETFKGISDQQVLEVFCRLNMNGIQLNAQELRNGKYFGYFKQLAYDLALHYLEFWRKHRVFTERKIARMLEVELTSELIIAGRVGMQDKKTSINDFYEKLEKSYPGADTDEKRFNETMATISATFSNGDLANSAFNGAPLFYTLYCVIFHHQFGMPGIQRASPRKRLTADERASLHEAVIDMSDVLEQSKDPAYRVPKKYVKFVAACKRQTDNIIPRKIRFDSLFDEAF